MTEITVVIKNPLSAGYRVRLEQLIGPAFRTINVTELQRFGVLGILRGMRSVRSTHSVVPIEDEGMQAILPILQMLAGLTRSKKLEAITPGLRRQQFTRWSLVVTALRLATSSLVNLFAAAACFFELRRLQRAARMRADMRAERSLLYINSNLWLGLKAGGSVGHISGVVNALLRKLYSVTFAACGGRLMVDEAASYVELTPPKLFGFPVELNSYRFHRSNVRELRGRLHQQPVSFIYQRLSAGNYSGVVLSRLQRIPLVTEYNGSEVWVAKNWGRPLKFHRLAALGEDAMLRHSELVVTVSDVLRDELIERGVEPARIVSYPNCIDERIFDPAKYTNEDRQALRAKWRVPADGVVVMFIGTFGQWHGVDVLAKAIDELVRSDAEWLERNRVRFVLVGDGLKMSEVQARLAPPEIAKFCVLTGLVPQPEAPRCLAASDLLMSPHVANPDGSRFFGSPTKLFEYMAMGKGIVASDLDQIGEVLANSIRIGDLPTSDPAAGDDRVALLTRPGEVADVVSGIRYLVERPAWRETLGRNAREEVLRHYTWSHHVDAILSGLHAQR